MYGSLFREWKVAACLVVGIAALAAAFFADGGGYEDLPGVRAKPVTTPAQVAAPVAATPGTESAASRFASDAELEAEFAEPAEPEASESAAPDGTASPVPAPAPLVATAVPAEADPGSAPAEQAH